jgi:hypothetical protein
MKKSLLITVLLAASFSLFSQEVDTIAAWTFPTGVDTVDIHPDFCIPDNVNRYIAAEDTAAEPICDITCTLGATTFAGTAVNWNDGENVKLWSIKFKAPGYSNFKVSSKQFSDVEFPGPKDWKVQARLSGGDWVDIEGGTVTCANDWTTGVVADLVLPELFNDPGTTSIYVRWIMTSNLGTSGIDVQPSGISKIDDVYVTGEIASGVGDVKQNDTFKFYPNPVENGFLYYQSHADISMINIYNQEGKLMLVTEIIDNNPLDITLLKPGIYLIEPISAEGVAGVSEKLIIQ